MTRILILLSLLTACTSEVCDPVGTYELVETYRAGDCGLSGNVDYNLIVTEVRGSYVFSVSNGGLVTPTVVGDAYVPDQDGVDCRLDVTATYDSPGSLVTETIALNTRGANALGNGFLTISFPDGASCQQELTFEGVIRSQ